MANEIVFYTNPMSRGRTVRWVLEEISVPYRTELLEFGTTMKSPAYLGRATALDDALVPQQA
jgi:glutathione S-transferase